MASSSLLLATDLASSAASALLSSPINSRASSRELSTRGKFGNGTHRRTRLNTRSSDDRGSQDEWRPPSDWDKAWKTYKNVGSASGMPGGLSKASSGPASSTSAPSKSSSGRSRPSPFKHMEQYVTRSPTFSDYPLAEETDAVRRTEREALGAWTDARFTFAGMGAVAMMLVYMVAIVGPPPS